MEVTRKVRKTRKRSNVPWAGWANEKPSKRVSNKALSDEYLI